MPEWRNRCALMEGSPTRIRYGWIREDALADLALASSWPNWRDHCGRIKVVVTTESKTLWHPFVMDKWESLTTLPIIAKWRRYYPCSSLLLNEQVEWNNRFLMAHFEAIHLAVRNIIVSKGCWQPSRWKMMMEKMELKFNVSSIKHSLL